VNPEKCTFGVPQGELLGYIIIECVIEANPSKILAITKMVLVLSCFVSWLGERGLPLYKLLKKFDFFHWTEEMQKALDKLKTLITKLSDLASLEPDKTFLLYAVTTTQVVSTTLVVEREEPEHVYKVQRSIYYIRKVLSDYETRYNQVQKQLYVILIMKCKLLCYFESHLVRVVTSHGLGEIIENHLATGRITKWALELMGLRKFYPWSFPFYFLPSFSLFLQARGGQREGDD
jgi:hypothetical protein